MADLAQFLGGGGFSNVFEYTANNTLVLPADTKVFAFELIGGGGGGGRGPNSTSNGGGGGGGTAHVAGVRTVSGGETLNIFVGAGGAGGVSASGSGGAGGTTYLLINNGIVAEGVGGNGGTGAGAGGGSNISIGVTSDQMTQGAAGAADAFSNVTGNVRGFDLSTSRLFTQDPSGSQGADNTAFGGGAGGASIFGAGGNGGDGSAGAGAAGSTSTAFGSGGGGGGGGNPSGNGADGASGVIRIYY